MTVGSRADGKETIALPVERTKTAGAHRAETGKYAKAQTGLPSRERPALACALA